MVNIPRLNPKRDYEDWIAKIFQMNLGVPEPQILVHQIIGSRSQNRRAHLYGMAIETLKFQVTTHKDKGCSLAKITF